jgi:hypothetical protein
MGKMWRPSKEIRQFKKKIRLCRSLKELEKRIASFDPSTQKPHGLPKPLVVSLTSYPARFASLPLTLNSILTQTVRPEKIILWVSKDDKDQIPSELKDIKNDIFEIAFCNNIRSFCKIIPSVSNFPDYFNITLDDDVYYWNTCLEELIGRYDANDQKIICHRAHEIIIDGDGLPKKYMDWKSNINSDSSSPHVFPCGVLGALYAPSIFHEDMCREDIFTQLCPTADDVWLYWMWRMTGHSARKIGSKRRVIEWPGTQEKRLRRLNVDDGGNDRCIRNMIERYGFPGSY